MTRFRPYQEADAPAVAAFFVRGAAQDPGMRAVTAPQWAAFAARQRDARFSNLWDGDQVVGVAYAWPHRVGQEHAYHFCIFVDPTRRRMGLGSRLFETLPQDLPVQCRIQPKWTAGAAFVEAKGLRPTRAWINMTQSNVGSPPSPRADFVTRPAEVSDFDAMARINNRAHHFESETTADSLAQHAKDESTSVMVLVPTASPEDIAGFCIYEREPDGTGWIDNIVVSPDHQTRGLGRHLMETVMGALGAMECPSVSLQVNADNPAVALYDALGFVARSRTRLYTSST